MLPFDPSLAQATDYLTTAANFRAVVAGDKATGWHAKVRGDSREDGAEIGVAFYELDYESKADATRRSKELLAWAKTQRANFDTQASSVPCSFASRTNEDIRKDRAANRSASRGLGWLDKP